MKLLIELRESEYIGILTRVATIGSDVTAADVIIANGIPIKGEIIEPDDETREFLDKKFGLGGKEHE